MKNEFPVLTYILLLADAVAGVGRVNALLAITVTTAGLCAAALPKYVEKLPRARATGSEHIVFQTIALSIFNAATVAVAAYVLGVIVRMVALA